MISITLAGVPVAKGRPRFVRATGHAYQPEKTRRFETDLRYAAAEVMASRPPLDCAVDLKVNVYLPIPESWSGKKQREAAAGTIQATKRPDIDNYLKAALDALNMIVWRDDAQVVRCEAAKLFSDRPRLEITVEPVPLRQTLREPAEAPDAPSLFEGRAA